MEALFLLGEGGARGEVGGRSWGVGFRMVAVPDGSFTEGPLGGLSCRGACCGAGGGFCTGLLGIKWLFFGVGGCD